MKTACATLLAFTMFAGSVMAATPLDGTFNGTYSCPSFQGPTNVLLNFTVTGYRVQAIEVIYHTANSKYKFGNSVIAYTGWYNPTKLTFNVNTLQTVGEEPSGWTYSKNLFGTVTANGASLTVAKDPSSSCTATTASKITATTTLKD